VDVLVTVDPVAYYHYDYVLKPDVARAIGAVNHFYKDQHKTMMLVVPGRIGTSSPELGVPVVFADICEFQAICEVSCSEAGYMPELSYGSHMFQDLVEADMLYCAIYQNEKTLAYTPGLFASCPNLLSEILPQAKDLESILSVYDLSGQGLCLYHDMESGETLCARG
jgi:pyruvate,water dikinase